jgi:hypothetical protein
MKTSLRKLILIIIGNIIKKYDKEIVCTGFSINRFHDGIWEFKNEGIWKRYHYEDLSLPDLIDELDILITYLNNTDENFDLMDIVKGLKKDG